MNDINEFNDLKDKSYKPASRNHSVPDTSFALMFLQTVSEVQKEEWEDNTSVSGSTEYDLERQMKNFIATRLQRSFTRMEGAVDRFIRNNVTDRMNYTFLSFRRQLAHYKGKRGKEYKVELDYFEYLDKVWTGTSGAGDTKTHTMVSSMHSHLNKSSTQGFFPKNRIIICLVYALLLLLLAGTLAPNVPDYYGMLLAGEYETAAKWGGIIVTVVGALFVWSMLIDESGISGFLGKLSFPMFLGSIAVAVMMYNEHPGRIDPGYLELLALYSGIISLTSIIDGFVGKTKARGRRSLGRTEFRHGWELERVHFDRYIRFHAAWWASQMGSKSEPECLVRMRREYEAFESAYKTMS